MELHDKPTFFSLLIGIAELHGRELSETVLEIYWGALQSFTLPDLQRAFSTLLTNPDTGQYLPKPADIVRMLTGNSQTQALQAWAKVERAIRQVGSWQTVVFDDPIIHATIRDMGGWIALCQTPTDELAFRAKEFENRYRGFVPDPPKDYPRALIGQAEAINAQSGKAIAPPVATVIGQLERARTLYRAGVSSSESGPMITRSTRAVVERLKLIPPEPEPAPIDYATAMAKMREMTAKRWAADAPPAARPEPFHSDPKRRAELQAALEAAMSTRKESA